MVIKYNLQTLFVQIEKSAKIFLFVLNVFKILLPFLHLNKNVFVRTHLNNFFYVTLW